MSNTVAIDPGFGFTKALINSKEIKFANIVGNYRPSEGNIIGGGDNLSIQVDGLGEWNFGDTAILQSSGGGSRRQSSDRIFTKEYLAGLLLAISEGYSPNRRDIEVDIITGLPGTEYNRDKAYKTAFREFITGTYHVHRPGSNQRITIKSIRWTQQAWGAIWKHLISEKGDPVKPDTRANEVLIGCVNVGYRTVEIGTVEVSGIQNGSLKVQMASGIELSEPDGIHRLIKTICSDLTQRFNQPFNSEQAIQILENGGFIFEGDWKSYQLSDDIKYVYNSIVYNHSTKVYDNGTAFLWKFINTGGGANITKTVFSKIPQLAVSDDPQWDTVIGYQRLAKLISKRSK